MKKEKGYTNFIKRKTEYYWRISDISSYIKCSREGSGESTQLFSTEFSTESQMEDKWRLGLYFNDSSDLNEDKDYISLYLYSYNEGKDIKTNYTMFCLDSSSNKVKIWTFEYVFKAANNGYGTNDFVEKKEILESKNSLIPNDTLTIGIQLIVFEPSTIPNDDMIDEPSYPLADDYKKLYSVGQAATADVIFKVKNQEIGAHKAVLIARCPLFAEIFSIKTANKEEPITIPDVSRDTLYSFLEYIYYDEVIELDCYAETLFEFASKYKLQALKEICAKSLHKTLHTHNALRLLVLATECDAPELIDDVSEFIAINSVKLTEILDYKSIQKSNPAISLILLRKLADLTANGHLKLKS